MMDSTALTRFEAKYIPEPNSGCWLWTGAICAGNDGYGQFRFEGKTQGAHCASYQIHRGQIPAGHDVCHTCDMPCCVNPDHLFVGTRLDNMQDAKRKGRLTATDPKYLRANRFRHEDKTHCPQGHPYDDSNTYLYQKKDGSSARHCIECRRATKLRYRARHLQ